MAVTNLVRVSLARLTPGKYIHPTMDFVLQRADLVSADPAVLVNQVWQFFIEKAPGATQTVWNYLAPVVNQMSGTPHVVRVYDLDTHLDGSPTGSPIYEATPTPLGSITGAQSLPDECAICFSYSGDTAGVPEFVGKTRPAARLRGRIYLGPLDIHTLASAGATFDPVVAAATCTDIVTAAQTYLVGQAPPNGNLQVWSRANQSVVEVYDTWVENLFDTRRHRGARRVGTKHFIDITP